MAHVDEFLRQLVAPNLMPGETILGMGLVRHPKEFTRSPLVTAPKEYHEHLAVATDRRFIVFETQVGGIFSVEAKAVATNPVEWRYHEIQEVRASPANWPVAHSGGYATVFAMVPYPGCGPYAAQQQPGANEGVTRRYDIFAACKGLDGQQGMSRQFPFWLQAQVAAGAFPLDPARRAAVDAQRAANAAQGAHLQAQQAAAGVQARADAEVRRAASAEKWKRAKPVVIPLPIALAGLAAMVVGGLIIDSAGGYAQMYEERAARYAEELAIVEDDVDSWVGKPGKKPPSDCPEEDLEGGQGSLKRCHGCSTDDTEEQRHPPLPGGWIQFQRGGSWWVCPDRRTYEERLDAIEKEHEDAVASAADRSFLGQGVLAAFVGLFLTALAVFLRVRLARAAKAA